MAAASKLVTADTRSAERFLCDQVDDLPLVHAALADVRLVATTTLLRVLHRRGVHPAANAPSQVDRISDVRSRGANDYVRRVLETLG